MDKAYSINDEEFTYSTPADALQALADEGRLVEGAIYWEIDVEDARLSDYLEASRILEFAAESIYDDVGEAAEDAFTATQEAQDELNALIAAWCDKHFTGERYWRCRGCSREIKATAADVAEYAG